MPSFLTMKYAHGEKFVQPKLIVILGQKIDYHFLGPNLQTFSMQFFLLGTMGGKKRGRKGPVVEEEEEEYFVEKILDKRINNGVPEYFLKWKGFSSLDNTWEPEENLNCTELLLEFNKTWKETSEEKTSESQPTEDKPEENKPEKDNEVAEPSTKEATSTEVVEKVTKEKVPEEKPKKDKKEKKVEERNKEVKDSKRKSVAKADDAYVIIFENSIQFYIFLVCRCAFTVKLQLF